MLGFFGKLTRCVVGLEACGGSHFWAREIRALGHDVRLIPPAYVKPYGAPRRRVLPVEEESIQRVVD
jgi:transposase